MALLKSTGKALLLLPVLRWQLRGLPYNSEFVADQALVRRSNCIL